MDSIHIATSAENTAKQFVTLTPPPVKKFEKKTAEILLGGAEIRRGVREGLGNAYPEIKPITHEGQKGSGELPKGWDARDYDRLTPGQVKSIRFSTRNKIEEKF